MNFLTVEQVTHITKNHQTPIYVYSEQKLLDAAQKFLDFPSAFGHTVRYAMKANPNINILNIFKNKWIKIDCSSEYEAYRALYAWFKGKDIQISGQETPLNLKDLLNKWVFFVATSMHQIETIGKIAPWSEIGIRINPGFSSGAVAAISTWWKISAFGIWNEYTDQIQELAQEYDLKITKFHVHIGSENTALAWKSSAQVGLDILEKFPDVVTFDMWGGFKEAIMPYETSADLQEIGKSVAETFKDFAEKAWRKIHLEIEPGKALVINSGSVIAKVDDIVDTWVGWHTFIRTNTGMTEMPRPSMYGVQQPITVVNENTTQKKYVVVGHCCESWDLLTPKLYHNETVEEIELSEANIWDPIVFDGVWAYSSAMSVKHYNSFPEAAELMLLQNWEIKEIRKRQQSEDVWKNEVLI